MTDIEIEKLARKELSMFAGKEPRYTAMLFGFDTGYKAAKSKNEWISIEERLPEINQEVLGYRPMAKTHSDDVITILKYEGGLREDLNNIKHGFERNHYVSHWMPLPEPPTK